MISPDISSDKIKELQRAARVIGYIDSVSKGDTPLSYCGESPAEPISNYPFVISEISKRVKKHVVELMRSWEDERRTAHTVIQVRNIMREENAIQRQRMMAELDRTIRSSFIDIFCTQDDDDNDDNVKFQHVRQLQNGGAPLLSCC